MNSSRDPSLSTNEPWWSGGLAFACRACGACCRGPGNVWISDAEIASLARALGSAEDDVRAQYTRRAGRRARRDADPGADTVLRSKRNQDCVFWESGTGCTIYAHRPKQCRTYPFWRANLSSRETWEAEGAACRGIGSGPVHRAEEIVDSIREDGIPSHRTQLRARLEESKNVRADEEDDS